MEIVKKKKLKMVLINLISIFLLTILVALYAKFCVNRFKFYKLVDKIPGPKKFPVPGIEGIYLLAELIGKTNQGLWNF